MMGGRKEIKKRTIGERRKGEKEKVMGGRK